MVHTYKKRWEILLHSGSHQAYTVNNSGDKKGL